MNKIISFQKQLQKENIDLAVLLNNNELIDTSFFYFTGLKTEYEILIIPKAGKPTLIASSLEYERAKKFSKIKSIVRMGTRKEFEKLMNSHLKGRTIGLNMDFLPVNIVKKLKKLGSPRQVKDISRILIDQRAVKTIDEEKMLQKACDISKTVFANTINQFKRGKFKTEIDVKNYMESEMKKFNTTPSFPIIVASGQNASMPHHEPTANRLNKGFCIIDFGVNYQGYCSDITRTIYLGKPGYKEVEYYYELLGLQEETITKMTVGTSYNKVSDSVRKVLAERLIHGLGHGLGIDVHEPLTTQKRLILKQGMYLTIEPGIYERGKYGIRIEDDILITKSLPRIFSKGIGKELIAIRHD